MRRLKPVLAAILVLFVAPAIAKDPVALKRVSFYEFMQHKITVKIPLSIPVPREYEPAKIKKSQFLDSYWMRPADAEQANLTDDVPKANGFMFAFPSSNVGYDSRKGIFSPAEEPEVVAQTKAKGWEVSEERVRAGRYPALLMKTREVTSGTLVYAMYIGLNDDTATVYISYRPPGNSREAGDFVWAALRQALKDVR